MKARLVVMDDMEIMSVSPCFTRTRVLNLTIIDLIKAGYPIYAYHKVGRRKNAPPAQ